MTFKLLQRDLYLLHLGFDPSDADARIYRVDARSGKAAGFVTLGPAGNNGGGGIDVNWKGEIFFSMALGPRNGFSVSAFGKVADGFHKEEAGNDASPEGTTLNQNYPNPFNPTTKIQFTVVNRQLTIVKVYDVLGREVTTLVNEVKEPGTYTVEFDGSNLSSGVYLYRMQVGDVVQTRGLLLLR